MLNSDIVLPLFLLFVKGFYRLFYEFFVKEHALVLNVLKKDCSRRDCYREKEINFPEGNKKGFSLSANGSKILPFIKRETTNFFFI